jgi:hypothetical protein
LRFKDRCPPCATNILVITRRGRRVAQAALELCGSSERLGLMTLISSMSLNAERVACRTSTPWKSRQRKRRFRRSYRKARKRRRPRAAVSYQAALDGSLRSVVGFSGFASHHSWRLIHSAASSSEENSPTMCLLPLGQIIRTRQMSPACTGDNTAWSPIKRVWLTRQHSQS